MNRNIARFLGAALLALLTFGASSLTFSARIAIALVIGLPAFILTIVSRRQLGNSFSVIAEAKALVTTGLYSRIQHPIYVFLDLFLLALILALDMTILLSVWGVIVILQLLQARREESVLRASFGADYEAYAKRTWF